MFIYFLSGYNLTFNLLRKYYNHYLFFSKNVTIFYQRLSIKNHPVSKINLITHSLMMIDGL